MSDRTYLCGMESRLMKTVNLGQALCVSPGSYGSMVLRANQVYVGSEQAVNSYLQQIKLLT